jgi:hypothetical protein
MDFIYYYIHIPLAQSVSRVVSFAIHIVRHFICRPGGYLRWTHSHRLILFLFYSLFNVLVVNGIVSYKFDQSSPCNRQWSRTDNQHDIEYIFQREYCQLKLSSGPSHLERHHLPGCESISSDGITLLSVKQVTCTIILVRNNQIFRFWIFLFLLWCNS